MIDPCVHQKSLKREKELEAQIKALKEDINRKKDLINSLKATHEKVEKEVEEKIIKVESKKDDSDKISKLTRELSRKEAMLKEFKTQYDELKDRESKSSQEVKSLQGKLKSLKTDLSRKESMIKETKDKLELEMSSLKSDPNSSIELSKHKEIVRKYKQDIERKDLKITSLESKIITLDSTIEKIKSESFSENKEKKDAKKDINSKKLKKMQEISQNALFVVRRILKDMILSAEKLRSDMVVSRSFSNSRVFDANNDTTSIQTPMKKESCNIPAQRKSLPSDDNAISDMYKESMDILGVSLGELTEFVQPPQSPLADKLPMFDYNDPSCNTSSKNTVGPGLDFDDLDMAIKDNRDLDVYTKVINEIVDNPEKLLSESESLVQIFKQLFKEIKHLEAKLGAIKFSNSSKQDNSNEPNRQSIGSTSLDDYIKESSRFMESMRK